MGMYLMNKNPNWGGAREGAGRPKEENIKKSVVVRVAEELLPVIKALNKQHKAGQGGEPLLNVTAIQDSALQSPPKNLESELAQFKKTNLELVLQKDAEHSKAIKLETKVRGLQSSNKELKSQLKTLEHKEHDCMVLKKDGGRCSRPAKIKLKWQGVEINACLQHSKLN